MFVNCFFPNFSPEEIESLREKMQSESSLVVVGSADDALRVPKSRRKIENVTQSMVDTMVVDEVYDFIKKILANPPGPRTPTVLNSNIISKQTKSSTGDKATTGQQRKRKQDMLDAEGTPAKTKHLGKLIIVPAYMKRVCVSVGSECMTNLVYDLLFIP